MKHSLGEVRVFLGIRSLSRSLLLSLGTSSRWSPLSERRSPALQCFLHLFVSVPLCSPAAAAHTSHRRHPLRTSLSRSLRAALRSKRVAWLRHSMYR